MIRLHSGWLVAISLVLCSGSTALAGMLSGPILDDGLTVVIEDVVQVPFSSPSPPHARVNVLREAPDGSGRLFVNDLNGPLYVIEFGIPETYLDLSADFSLLKINPGLASGFVSFALDPEFGINGLFYTVHSEFVGSTLANLGPAVPAPIVQHSVLTEWQASDPGANTFSGTSRELMRIAAPHHFHNLGEIAFNPTATPADSDYGLLYVAAGDFGSVQTGQPEQLQRLDTPFGALMRIDPLGGPFMRNGTTYFYGIPSTNPYANDGDPDTLGEIYAHGFRNAHRISWDPDGLLAAIVSDIGEANIEEVNLLTEGGNYGWPLREGTFAIDVATDPQTVFGLPGNDAGFGFRYPVAQYDHDEGRAIAGGFVYRGSIAELRGKFVFGDIVNGRIFYSAVSDLVAADDDDPSTTAPVYELSLLHEGEHKTLLEIVRIALGDPGIGRTDLRFAIDLAGELHVTTKQDGWIRKLVAVQVIPPGDPALIAHWRFDEGFGAVASDDSGNGNAGNLVGPQWVADTPDGGGSALEFDTNDLIDLGGLDILGEPLTIALWFKANGFGGGSQDGRLISKATGAASAAHYWMVSTIESGGLTRLRFRLRTLGATTTLIASSGDLSPGVWTHVAAVYDGGSMRIYKDGMEVGNMPKLGPLDTNPGVLAAIGNQPQGAGTKSFDGLIDDVRIYERALSPAQIQGLTLDSSPPE